jgi:hypothetical protein
VRFGLGTALVVLFLSAVLPARAQYTIRWINDATAPAVEVEGITRDSLAALQQGESPAWSHLLAVYAEQPIVPGAPLPAMPPMAGTWKVTGTRLRFEPRFPFARGVAYRAEFWPSRLPGPWGAPSQLLMPLTTGQQQGPVISFFELPLDKTAPQTSVLQIYPSGDILPENQLKFYVHFSGPMSRGGIYQHVEMRGEDGQRIDVPFLELDEELWDPTMSRLTLLIDPGRIKRGVKPLEDIGPVFEQGKRYTLAIKSSWRDATGRPLRAGYEKTFRAGPPDRTPPDPARWTFQYLPPAGTQAPVIVQFDEPIDRALALRLIGVRRGADNQARRIDGEVVIDEQERRWMLQPVGPWVAGTHYLVVATTIEDLAGNNIGKTFDVELTSGAQRQLAAPSVAVPFEVR